MLLLPRALLFDLGNVLIDVDFRRALDHWAPRSALARAELERRFGVDDAYERHERGEIGFAAYAAHLAATLELDATAAEIEAGWNAIFPGEFAKVRRAIEVARRRLPCHVFSNTNASHTAAWRRQFPELVAAIDRFHLSHEIGRRKPEPAAFAQVCAAMALPPADILFFDDLPANVEAGRLAGLQALVVRQPGDVVAALRERGLA